MDNLVEYIPNYINKPLADSVFGYLQMLPWKRRDFTPRMELFYSKIGETYTYGSGGFERTYKPEPVFDKFVETIIAEYREDFELCFLNRYLNQSDHLGWHSDDSPEIDVTRPIAVLSLGVEREIWFREIPAVGADTEITKLKLEHGSLLIMPPGFQQTHQHRIPKAGFMCGERISLTYRGASNDN